MAASCVAAGQAVATRAPPAVVCTSQDRPSSFDTPQLLGKSLRGSKTSPSSGMSADRARRLFFLRAARPLLQTTAPLRRWQRSRAVSQKESDSKNKDSMAAEMETMAAGATIPSGMDPLPLHAQDTSFIAATDASSPATASPPSQPLNAVDWVLLKAQGVPIPSFDFDIKWNFPWPRDDGDSNSLPPPASLAERRDALKQELEVLELMLRPQCPWPRDPQAFIEEEWVLSEDELEAMEVSEEEAKGAAAFLVEESEEEIKVVEVLPIGPHCAWPRHAGRVSAPVKDASASPLVNAPSSVTPAAIGADAFPRCAWPRTNTKAATVSALSASASAVSNLSAVSIAPGPRCEWPRKSVNPLAPVPAPSTPAVPAARCAWPRTSASASAVSAIKSASALHSLSTELPEASAFSLEVSAQPAGARCAWPRQSAQAVEQRVLASPGPHCAWPRKSVLSAVAAPAVAALAVLAPAPAERGPRCSWPRATSAASAASAAVVSAALPHLDLAVAPAVAGPRCSWPRKSSLSAVPAAAAVVAEPAAPAEAAAPGPRCAWPRAVPTVSPMVIAPEAQPQEQQHRAEEEEEQRAVVARAAEVAAAAAKLNVSDGPRCMWPRGSVLSQALQGGLAGTGKGMMSVGVELPVAATASPAPAGFTAPVPLGPRCEWPRKGLVVAAAAAAVTQAPAVVDVEVVVPTMGPRCPWPRNSAAASAPAPIPAPAVAVTAAPVTPFASPVPLPRRQFASFSSSGSVRKASSLDQYMKQRKREAVTAVTAVTAGDVKSLAMPIQLFLDSHHQSHHHSTASKSGVEV